MELDIILEADLPPSQIQQLGLLAEQYNFRAIWAQNYARARDAFMSLVPLAQASKRIKVGVVVVSPYEMHPLKIANALLTLNEYSDGRAIVTVGAGGEWPGVMNVGYGKRITGAREALEIIKGSFASGKLDYTGEVYSARLFNTAWATDTPPLVYGGATGPKMLKMSAGIADGIMMSDIQIPMIKDHLPTLTDALAEAGRADDDFRISNFIAWHVKEDREVSFAESRRELMIRGWLERPWLEPFLSPEDTDFVLKNLGPFLTAFRTRSGNVEGIPQHILDAMVDGLSMAGDLSDLDRHVEKLCKFAESGFTEIALRIHDDPADSIRMIGEQVLPRLS